MNIEYLGEFVFLADTLSFKRTADHFYVSRSVISRHMAALEEMLGVRLIDRDGRAVSLTEAGRVFNREARTVLRDWDIALERVRSAGDDSVSLARIGYLRNASRPILVKFVRRMSELHPNVRLSLTCMEYGELRRAMEEHTVDVALALNVNPAISRNYRSTHVYEDDFYAVCAADHPVARGKSELAINDLRGRKIILPESFRDVGLSDLADALAGENTPPATEAFYRDLDMQNLKVQTEGYIAFSSGLNRSQFDDGFVMLPVKDANTSFVVSAFYHDDFTGEAYRACCEVFEWCHDILAD